MGSVTCEDFLVLRGYLVRDLEFSFSGGKRVLWHDTFSLMKVSCRPEKRMSG